jgi:hypothetical protein
MEHVLPIVVEPDAEERGRLKRRRQSSVSPRRASSPSRGHDRTSGSRYRQHHRKHHRPSSPASSASPPTVTQKKNRRRSDAEPDYSFRGRARNRSGSSGRTRSPILEDEDKEGENTRSFRKRIQPPSRHPIEEEDESAKLRRQRSHVNVREEVRRGSEGEEEDEVDSTKQGYALQEEVIGRVGQHV